MPTTTENLLTKYSLSLERENERLREDCDKLKSEHINILKEDYEKALQDIDKRDTILWKLGLCAASGNSLTDNYIIKALGKEVTEMQKKAVSDVDEIVENIYEQYCFSSPQQ